MALEGSAGAEEAALFHRKIEFHLARKQFKGFGNSSDDNGFKLVTLNPNASEPQKASASGNKSERSEARFDPELSFRITFRRIGAGLRNLGNTCFLNSVLQCLTYTEPLAAYLQSGKHQSSCRTAGFCALCAIQKHVSRALQSSGRILEPKDLVSNLRCISRNFRNARQEDAHEYMVNLLESMHKCCLPSGVPSESPSAYEKSLVHKIFGGRLRSQVKCMQCSYCSDKFDPFLDLSLEIARADSLYKALNHFTATEQLDGGAKQYQCQQCKQKVRALKQLTVYKAPNVLTIHLKRFGSHVQGQKINKNVAFGPNLDLKPFVTGPSDGDLKYTLYGVLVHAGWSTHSGHYYCFIRTSSGMWYSLDDNQVYQVSEKRVLEQKAYMLFYVRDGVNVCTMKPVDVHHKENMVANVTPIAVHTKLNPDLRLKTQNGLVERRLDGSSSADLSKDAPPRTAPMKNPSNGNTFEHSNSSMAGHCSDKRYPLSEPPLVVPPAKVLENCSTTATNSVVPPAKFLENSSTGVANSVGHQATPNSTSEASGSAHVSSHDTTIADCNYRVIGGEDVNDNRADKIQSDPAQSSLSSHEPCTASRKMRNIGGSNLELSEGKAVPAGTVEASSNICCLKSSKKRTIEECQVVDSPRSGNSTPEAGLRMSPDELTTTEQFPCATAKNRRPQLKLKRKHFMYQVSGMPLSSNIIFGAAFSMQKKQKRRKYQSLLNKSENLKSGSETAKKVKCGSDDDEKRIGIRNASRNGVISGKDINNGPKQRQRPKTDSTVVLSEKPQNTRDPVAQAPDCSENHWRESGKANTWSILTRGLDETSIARWDDIEISHSEKAESRKEQIIGYIGDEWDEEYDTGKRKKIKSTKISFDGPNLFQVIATNKNANRKRATLL